MDSQARAADVVLVGFEDQDNLGLRYLMSAVQHAGFRARIVTYKTDPRELIEIVRAERPLVVGLSLIFQYMAPSFAKLIEALRSAQVTAHITMGGHYPSFDPSEVLGRMPGLDSIVRFEGEQTLIELLSHLRDNEDWRELSGLALRRDGEVVSTTIRHSIEDLDTLPWPERGDIPYESQELPTASILGSRGCPWDCSFCSIRPFYEAQPGPLRRLRAPAAVVDEMEALHGERGVRAFLFQDDDFLGGGNRARTWAREIADGIIARGLGGKLAFKLSARSDEIREDLIEALAEAGLTHVYMGVESGDVEGLQHLEKHLEPSAHLRAGDILRKHGLSFDFGFMLLEPDSTFEIVAENIRFLDEFVGDGWTVASFCRMLPYAGAPIQKRLEEEGRLLGTPFEPDYRFLDPKLDLFYAWTLRTFHTRNFTNRGLSHLLKSLQFETRLKLEDVNVCTDWDRTWAQQLTAQANGFATNTLRAALEHFRATSLEELERGTPFLAELTARELEDERVLTERVVDFYWSLQRRRDDARQPLATAGGFDRGWTHAPASVDT